MDALKDPSFNMIGLYGMGGTGKTTLASEVERQARDAKLFDVVVMVTVSEKPQIRKIQGKIADVMGMKLEEETVDGRAYRLHQKLKGKEKILVILDNLWAAIELKAIGIPSGDEHKGCKILLTSRNLDVLTSGMGAQKFFKLEPLSEAEAWKLFQITVGNSNTQKMPSLATEVASKCVGIPLAIVTVAKALRNKELHAWKDALKQLSMTSRFDNTGMQAEVYAALELSFDQLLGEEVKLLLLLLPLYLDSSINIECLLRYGVGMGLFGGMDSIEDARNRLLKLIDDLKASCFLQDDDEDGWVKMHEFVQAFAMSIASRAQNAAVVKTGFGLKEFVERHIPNCCTRLSLLLSDIYDLPEDLECPELDFLLVEAFMPCVWIDVSCPT
uniref:Uncharacterized protein MANES_07G060500 n=1 Tax=Rhizophora mucronata TaxID=61149 RepID=A0A2P2M5V7_RHIMU